MGGRMEERRRVYMERDRSVPRGTGVIPMHQIMHKIPEKEEGGRGRRTRESKEGREEDLKAGLNKREKET